MDPKTKKKIIIGFAITTIVGVGGYFLWKWLKDTGKIGKSKEIDDDANVIDTPPGQYTPPPSSPAIKTDRPGDVLAFQKWANVNGWTPKLDEDGLWGPKTSSAWSSKKSDYQKKAEPEKADGDANKLTGQMKYIYDLWKKSNLNPTIYKSNKTGITYVKAKGASTKNIYMFGEGGLWYSFNPDATSLASGNYTNNGKTIIATSGPQKGKTITGSTPMGASAKASAHPEGYNSKLNLSPSQQADIVGKMYYAMKGPSTYTDTFWTQWSRLKSKKDYDAVKTLWGKKEGETLPEWIKDETALSSPFAKIKLNKLFVETGVSNRY